MNEINYMLDKLYKMNVYLGGNAIQYDFRTKNLSVFKKLGKDFEKKFMEVKKLINSRNKIKRDQGITTEVLKKTNQIKAGMELMDNFIDKMEKNLRKLKKNSEKYEEGNDIIFKCKNLLLSLKELEFFNNNIKTTNDIEKNRPKAFQNNYLEFDPESPVWSDDENDGGGGRRRRKKKKKEKGVDQNVLKKNQRVLETQELDKKEKAMLDRWKKQDQLIDKELEGIEEDLDKIIMQLDEFNENMHKNEVLIDYVSHQANALTTDLKTSNARMKIIVERFTQPGRLCLEISNACCLCMLIGLFVYLLQKYLAAILVMKSLQNQEKNYSVIKIVGTVDKYESFNKLQFRLYAFKYTTYGKKESYQQMQIKQMNQPQIQDDLQNITQTQEKTLLEERDFNFMYTQYEVVELDLLETGEYSLPENFLLQLKQNHKKVNQDILDKDESHIQQSISNFFKLGNSTDQHFIQIYSDTSIDRKTYKTSLSLEFKNSPILFKNNVLFVMDFIQENTQNTEISYFQLSSSKDKNKKSLRLKVTQQLEQSTSKWMYQKLGNFFSTTYDQEITILQKSKTLVNLNEPQQLELQYYQGNIEHIKKQRVIKDQQGNNIKEEYETDKVQIPKQNKAKFQLVRDGKDVLSEVQMVDSIDSIFPKNKQLNVHCQLRVDKMVMATEYFIIEHQEEDQTFYTDDDRFEYVNECWNKIKDNIRCSINKGNGMNLNLFLKSQNFQKQFSKRQIQFEDYSIIQENSEEEIQNQNRNTSLVDQAQIKNNTSLKNSSINNFQSEGIEMDSKILKRLLTKDLKNQAIVMFEMTCEKQVAEIIKKIII